MPLSKALLRSSTFKLSLIYIGLFSALLLCLLGYVYWSTTSYIQTRSDRVIGGEYSSLAEAFSEGGLTVVSTAIRQRIAERRLHATVYILADPTFAPIAGNAPSWPSGLRDDQGWANIGAQEWKEGAPTQSSVRAQYGKLPDGSHLLVGEEIEDPDEFVATIRSSFTVAIALMFLLAAVASVTVSRRTVGRIEAINRTSQQILHSGLNNRIPVRGTRDEWDRLAENLNSMLDRIEGLVEEIRQVTNNVAHDLRTPLARMRGRLERAYNERLDPDHYKALVGDTIGDLDGILGAFSSILRIAQMEAQDNRKATFRPVELTKVAGEVAELFEPAAEERGGRIELAGLERVYVMGDRDLLFDAISNLLDNAIKHGGGDQVTVEVARASDGPVIIVSDSGPGIPEGEYKRVLKRFYRLERSRSTSGHGLGLSLVAAVANLHSARIEMASNSPGLRVELHFPMTTA